MMAGKKTSAVGMGSNRSGRADSTYYFKVGGGVRRGGILVNLVVLQYSELGNR